MSCVRFHLLLAVLLPIVCMLGVSTVRYSVIKYPLSGKGRKSMKSKAVFSATFVLIISIVLYIQHQVEDLSYLSSPLCILYILLGKSKNSKTQSIVTVVV